MSLISAVQNNNVNKNMSVSRNFFYILFLDVNAVPTNLFPGLFSHIVQFERVGKISTFSSNVFRWRCRGLCLSSLLKKDISARENCARKFLCLFSSALCSRGDQECLFAGVFSSDFGSDDQRVDDSRLSFSCIRVVSYKGWHCLIQFTGDQLNKLLELRRKEQLRHGVKADEMSTGGP